MSKYKVGDKVNWTDDVTGKSGVGKVDSMQIYYSVITDSGKCVAAHEDDLSPYVEQFKVGDLVRHEPDTRIWEIIKISGQSAWVWTPTNEAAPKVRLSDLTRA